MRGGWTWLDVHGEGRAQTISGNLARLRAPQADWRTPQADQGSSVGANAQASQSASTSAAAQAHKLAYGGIWPSDQPGDWSQSTDQETERSFSGQRR